MTSPMFLLKKILTPFLMPCGLLTLYLFLSGIFFWRRRRSFGIAQFLAALLLWAFSSAPVPNALLKGLERPYYDFPPHPAADAIVVLGGGVNSMSPDMDGRGALSGTSLERVVAAVRLYKKTGLPVVVSGGRVFGEGLAEAFLMKSFLARLGVPENKITMEDRSRDTRENAAFVKKICDARGFKTVLLVTSASHMRRAAWCFEKNGLKAVAWPAGFMTGPGRQAYVWIDFFPQDLRPASMALNEYLGLAFYRLAY
jgi:uncharacterized SAM-binding protein YcdF (DUF218 family)